MRSEIHDASSSRRNRCRISIWPAQRLFFFSALVSRGPGPGVERRRTARWRCGHSCARRRAAKSRSSCRGLRTTRRVLGDFSRTRVSNELAGRRTDAQVAWHSRTFMCRSSRSCATPSTGTTVPSSARAVVSSPVVRGPRRPKERTEGEQQPHELRSEVAALRKPGRVSAGTRAA